MSLEAFTLQALALHLAGAANGLCSFTRTSLGRLLVMPTQLHLAEDAFALHLLLERLERLIDIVVTDKNLHWAVISWSDVGRRIGGRRRGLMSGTTSAIPEEARAIA